MSFTSTVLTQALRLETDLMKTSSEFPHSRAKGRYMRPHSFGTVQATQFGIAPRLGSTYVPLQCSSPQKGCLILCFVDATTVSRVSQLLR